MGTFSTLFQKRKSLAFCGVAAILAYASPSFAQQVPGTATTTANPARVEERVRSEIKEAPTLSSRVEVKDVILQKVPDGAENIHLVLNSVSLSGVSAYATGDLEAMYADKIGATITLADVYRIASSLTRKYRNDGYILTQVIVPPQTIEGGDIKLRVVEGFIENISVEGAEDQQSSLGLVRRYVAGIETGTTLNIADLERYLLLISDLPGLDARSVLSPSTTTTGAADLRIVVTRDPYDVFLAVNNYGSRYLGPYQFTAFGSVNSFFGNNERITAQIVAAPDPGIDAPGDLELGYFALAYEQPVPFLGLGTTMELYTSYTDTQPGYDLRPFDVKGISKFVSAKISHPFIRSRSENLFGHLQLDVRNVTSRNNIQATLRDKIRAVRIGADYQFLDTVFGVGINSVSMEFSHGLDILGSTDKGDANITRGAADPAFNKITADIQRLQRITSDINLLVATQGQLSASALLSSEEFGVGGTEFGRGYDSSEIVGDDGVAGKIELQWNQPYKADIFDDYQLFGFYDVGRVWNKDATTSSQKKDIITSTGLGVRAEFLNGIQGDLFVALPLNRDVQTKSSQKARFFFNVSRSF